MANFFERNKSIFTMGLIIALIFAVILVAYRLRPGKETPLTEIGETNNQEFYKVTYENEENYPENYSESTNGQEESGENENPEEPKEEVNVDEIFGSIKIDYTTEGFKPKILRSYIGQNIEWTNKTDKSIYLQQIKPTYEEFKQPIEIKPNETFTFRMTQLGIWTYEESESGDFGSIEVKPLPKNLPVSSTAPSTE
ncbi:MAG TPA: hypothetical protein PKH50_02225 [bacterium]|jgi:plastocyanin|nr:hypothetical protein [bacterium]